MSDQNTIASVRTLTLHRHSDKTEHELDKGKRISAGGAKLANGVASRLYPANQPIDIVFHGPLPRTLQTLTYMMFNNAAFDNVVQYPEPISGLGDDAMFATMFTDEVKVLIPEHGLLGAILEYYDDETAKAFANQCLAGIKAQFDLMELGQTGVGVFHDPTIALAAWLLGYEDVRSLESMESISFQQDTDGTITVISLNALD
ncbi:hypothetical protein K8R42_00565 [bacterium]|nr:hypothetical protein [bacterium]